MVSRTRGPSRKRDDREAGRGDCVHMTIPFPPVARSACGSTSGEKADMARRTRRTRGLRAPRPPRDPPAGVVRIGKIRNSPFLILPIRDMPPGRVALRGKIGSVGGSSSAPERRGWSRPANPCLPPGNRACGRPQATRQSRNPCLPLSHYPAPEPPGSPQPPARLPGAPAGSATGRAPARRAIRGSPEPERRGRSCQLIR